MSVPGTKALDVWNVLVTQLNTAQGIGMNLFYNSVVAVGDVLLASIDAIETSSSDVYEKVKEFTVYATGTFRLKFDLKTSSGVTAYGRIYKNGAAFGTEQTNATTSYVEKSEDLAFRFGDTVELWLKRTSPDNALARNYRIYDSTGNFTVV